MAGLITGIAGAVISAGTTAASFIQAGQQKRKQQDFEADAARALAEARKKLQVNYAEAMSVNKEPYNQERLSMLSAGAQIAQAAAESERGAAAVAGKLLASQQAGQADISNRQGVDMQNIQNAILEEESRLRDVNVGLDVQEIAGQQQAAADAKLAADMAKQQGIQGIANTFSAGMQLIPLYGGLGSKNTPQTPPASTESNMAAPVSNMPSTQTPTAQTSVITPEVSATVTQATPPTPSPDNAYWSSIKPEDINVIDPTEFQSPTEAAIYGYIFDEKTGGYVKASGDKYSSFLDKNIQTREFKSPRDAADFFYFWDNAAGKYVQNKPRNAKESLITKYQYGN